MGFVCEEGGPFRKLPTPALPGSGSRVLRSGADLSFSAPLFLCPAPQYSAPAPKCQAPAGILAAAGGAYVISGRAATQGRRDRMNVEPEQRAALLGEYIAEHSATVRAAARCVRVQQIDGAQGRMPCGCGPRMQPCAVRAGAVPCWPATRPSVICGAGRRPGANTKSRRAVQGGLCRSPVYLCRNCSSAAFSSRETCAWLMPISCATSIWVLPLAGSAAP